MKRNLLATALISAGLMMSSYTAFAQDDLLTQAKDVIAHATAPVTKWDGPTTGPQIQKDKKIIVITSYSIHYTKLYDRDPI